MRYTIEGFSQTEAIKFRRIEIVKDSKGNDKEKVVTLDCTDLVILRWFVDFFPRMMKVEIGGRQYAWLNYKSAIEDMPLLGIKKGMFALRLKKLVDFGILSHQTVKSGGTFSYYGFGPQYGRLIDTEHAQQNSDPAQNVKEGVPKILDTPTQNISDQIDPSTKDSSTKDNKGRGNPTRHNRPTVDEVRAYCEERRNGIDPQHFIDYQEARGWRLKGGQPVKDWKAVVRTWERMEGKWKTEERQGQQEIDLSDFEESRKKWGEYVPEEVRR